MRRRGDTNSAAYYGEVVGEHAAELLLIYRYWLGKLGLPHDFRPARVPVGSIGFYLDSLRAYLVARRKDPDWRGCNVTEPLEEAAAALVDRLDPMAARLGLVDLIMREGSDLLGCNSSARAFIEPLRPHMKQMTKRTAMVIGSGRAARMVAHVLAISGFRLDIFNRRVEHARTLVYELGRQNGHEAHSLMHPPERPEQYGLLVNATPARRDFMPDFTDQLDLLVADAVVYDLILDPIPSPLLKEAERRGHRTINGIDMLIEKAAFSFHDMFRHHPPRSLDRQVRLLVMP